MQKQVFTAPIMQKGAAQVYEVVCKKAACSGKLVVIDTLQRV